MKIMMLLFRNCNFSFHNLFVYRRIDSAASFDHIDALLGRAAESLWVGFQLVAQNFVEPRIC